MIRQSYSKKRFSMLNKLALLCIGVIPVITGCSGSGEVPQEAPMLMSVEYRNEAVLLNWTTVENATGYKIKYGTESQSYTKTLKVGNQTSCTVGPLENGTGYYFAVAAVSGAGEGPLSNELYAEPGPYPEKAPGEGSFVRNEKIKHGTIWVSNYGDDINNDGTKKKPLRTIGYALSQALPGDTIIVKKGVYYEYDIGLTAGGEDNLGGTDDKKITVKSEELHGAVIDAMNMGEAIRLSNKHNLIFDGFEVRNSSGNLIHADGKSSNLVFRNLIAHHAYNDGDVMKFNQSRNITVENCDVSYPALRVGKEEEQHYQELIDFLDVDNAVVRNCRFHHAGTMAIYAKGGSRNAIFENNILLGNNLNENPGDGLLGIGSWSDSKLFVDGDEYEAYNMIVRNNIIIGAKSQAIGIYDSFGARIYNNVIVNSNEHSIFFRKGNSPKDESRDTEIFNNIFIDTRGKMVPPVSKQRQRAVYDVKLGNNIFWNNGSPIPTGEYNYNLPVVDVLKDEYNSIVKDPGFDNLVVDFDKLEKMSNEEIARMFTPKKGSPAWESGVVSEYAPENFFGKKREKTSHIGIM